MLLMNSRHKQKGTQQQAGEREESEALSLLVQSNPSERTKHVDTPNAVWADRITPRPTKFSSAYHPEAGFLKYLR
jgi:hypothetical protein